MALSIQEKLDKEKQTLKGLQEKKQTLENRISKTETNIKKYETILLHKEFEITKQLLDHKGLNLEALNNALEKNDLLELQERIEESNEE